VIKRFRHRGLKRLFEDGDASKIPPDTREKIENILFVLNRTGTPSDMDLPGFRPHPLKGKLQGFWAVTVRGNWRIVWRFENADAVDVDFVDYH
jgi:proteic killer suppression protein